MKLIHKCSNCKFGYFRENFVSRIEFEDICATLKIREYDLICQYQPLIEWFRHFARV